MGAPGLRPCRPASATLHRKKQRDIFVREWKIYGIFVALHLRKL